MILTFSAAALTVAVYMTCIFLLALAKEDNSIADIAYGGAFIAAVASAATVSGTWHPRQFLIAAMVVLWGS